MTKRRRKHEGIRCPKCQRMRHPDAIMHTIAGLMCRDCHDESTDDLYATPPDRST